jgi:hypothetical protein
MTDSARTLARTVENRNPGPTRCLRAGYPLLLPMDALPSSSLVIWKIQKRTELGGLCKIGQMPPSGAVLNCLNL